MMKEMEEDLQRHRQGNFFKKMKLLTLLTGSKVTPPGTILDEAITATQGRRKE